MPPPDAGQRADARCQPARRRELLAHVRAQRLDVLGPDPLGQEALRGHDGAEAPGARGARLAVDHAGELHGPAADVQRHAVAQGGRVDGREIAVARLLRSRQHLDLEPGAHAGAPDELLAVAGLADRRRGARADVLDARGAAEVGEQLDRLERPLHRGRLQRAAALRLPLADAHGLVDLVRALPPLALHPGEDDEPEGVRPEVDDREPLLGHLVALDQFHPVAVRIATKQIREPPARTV